MSVAIKNALGNLDKAIDRAEAAMLKRAKTPRANNGQPDLFTAPAPANAPAASNVVGFDRGALARKLDMTIARVEQLLSEA